MPRILTSVVCRLVTVLSIGMGATALATAPANASDDPRRPSAITTTGVPAVPDHVWERLRQYQAARSAVFRGWSPDGNGILIATRFGETAQLHRVYAPGGRREQVTFFEEPVDGGFIPKDRQGNLLLRASLGGNENDQIFRFDRSTGLASRITDGKSRNLLMAVARDGTQGVIGHNGRNGRDTDLYLFKTSPGAGESAELSSLLNTDAKFLVAYDWSPDRRRLVLLHVVSATLSYPYLFDVESRQLAPLPPPDDRPARFSNPAFSADGKGLFITCDAWGEFRELARYDIAAGTWQRLSADIPWDIDSLTLDETTGRLAFTSNADGVDELYLLDGDHRVKLPLPGPALVAGLEFSPDGKQLGLTIARAQAPADAYSLDLATKQLTRWTYSEVGGLDTEKFVAPRLVRFPTFDGREIPAYVSLPPGASPDKPCPVVIDIHGGPEGQYRPFFSGVDQFLVRELGYAVIHPNVRGSDGYGKTYLSLDNAAKREDSVRDIGALLDWVATQKELDSRNVAVYGVSYGGYMVLGTLVHYSDRLKGGIDVVGIGDFETFLSTTAAYRRDLRRVEYGDERDPEMREVFARISPLRHAEKIKTALLVVHGRNDPRVPFSEAEQIAERVSKQGNEVWTVYADNEGHGFAKKPNRDYQTAVQILFLQARFSSAK